MTKTEKNSWLVKDRSFYKTLAAIALPIAGQNAITFCVGLIDNVMVSSLGEAAVGGVYIFNQVQNIVHMLMLGVGAALVILAAQHHGSGNSKAVKTICAIAMRLALGVGVVMTALMCFQGENILSLLTSDEGVLQEGIRYTAYMRWSFLFFCMSNVLLAAMRSVGSVKIGLITSCITVVTDAGLNYLLIFGNLGFPKMGVSGAALATLISRVIEFAVILLYILYKDEKLRLRPKDLLLFDKSLTRAYFVYGAPVILGDILWGFGGAAQSAIIGRMGQTVIAAGAIAMNVYQIFAVLIYGFANAGSIVVGREIGKNEFETAKKYTKTLQLVYVCVGVCSAAVLFLLRGPVLMLYPDMEKATSDMVMQFLLVLCFMMIGTSYQMSSLQIVRAGGSTHFVLINDLIFIWLVVIPLSCLTAFVLKAPAWVVFLCLKSDQVLKCSVAAVKVNRFKWMKNLTKAGE